MRSGWTRRKATAQVTFAPPDARAATERDNSGAVFLGGLAASGLVLTLLVGYVLRQRRPAGRPGILRTWLPPPPFRRASEK